MTTDDVNAAAAEMAKTAEQIVEACRPIFAGQGPGPQGAALAELVSIWLAGHPVETWEALTALHTQTAVALAGQLVALRNKRPRRRKRARVKEEAQ
jgi:hypothetical protein